MKKLLLAVLLVGMLGSCARRGLAPRPHRPPYKKWARYYLRQQRRYKPDPTYPDTSADYKFRTKYSHLFN